MRTRNNILLLTFIYIISKTLNKLMAKTYNFGNQQNYEIDLLYEHLLGQHLYFVTNESKMDPLYIMALYPSLDLDIKFKFYSSNLTLDNDAHLLFGIDLNVDIIDQMNPSIRTDIIVCQISSSEAECEDYYYNSTSEEYIKNKVGNNNVYLNSLIPLGFSEIDFNILKENVIKYNYYYYVNFKKEFPPIFDNVSMTNWINYVAGDMDAKVIGFWKYISSNSSYQLPDLFKLSDGYTQIEIPFKDGGGISNLSIYIKINLLYVLFILCILL